jgi:hypothetical protein
MFMKLWLDTANIDEIREIAYDLADETGRAVSVSQVTTGLSVLKRLTEHDVLHWWEP